MEDNLNAPSAAAQDFEALIQSDKKLKLLLIDQDITVLTSFKPTDYPDEGLKTYIEDRYIEAGKKIIKDNIRAETEGKIASLVRSMEVLAKPKVEDAIVAELSPIIGNALMILDEIKQDLIANPAKKQVNSMIKIDDAMSYWLMGVFNDLTRHDSIAKSKEKFLELGLDICDLIKNAKAKEDTPKYALYNVIMNHFEKVKDKGSQSIRYNALNQKLNRKRSAVEWKYILGVIGLIILFLLKFIIRLAK